MRRSDFDLERSTIGIERSVIEVKGSLVVREPKTRAGVRIVTLPVSVAADVARHLDLFAEPGPEGRVFIGPNGATPHRTNFSTVWARAKRRLGPAVPQNLHFHDLRHAGNHFAASTGASTRDLMSRLGHASVRAALIYQHRTEERDRAIATALDVLIEQQRQ